MHSGIVITILQPGHEEAGCAKPALPRNAMAPLFDNISAIVGLIQPDSGPAQ
jgi:hypothetical protein